MKTLHPQTHASLSPRALLLAPLAARSPARAAGLGFALGLALTLALLPLAQRIGAEPSPTPTPASPRLLKAHLTPTRSPTRVSQTRSGRSPERLSAAKRELSGESELPASEAPTSDFPESEIAEELFEGELPPGELPEADVEAGLAQAKLLCRRVRGLISGPWEPLRVGAIRQLLEAPAIEAESYGELPAIRSELDWIEGLESSADLGERSLEDLRFLVSAIHWYLEGATEPLVGAAEHLDQPTDIDAECLIEFAGMDYADLLAEWD